MIWIPIIGMADSEDKKKDKKSADGKFPKSRPQKNEEGQLRMYNVFSAQNNKYTHMFD